VERDLGIYIDPPLNFDGHIQEVMSKCNKILWVIKRAVASRSPVVIKKLYTSLVRPHLEYYSQALILRKKEPRVSKMG
jgi:hypothetical protein